jgi:GNAT superfamily N-acetyltransferase
MEIEIRTAAQFDLPAIIALHVELEANSTAIDLAQAGHIFERMQHYPDYHIYVAIVDEKIVATFALLIMDNLAHHGAPSGIVEDVVVHASYQGQGIGKQLMLFAMERCKDAGCYKLMLSSNLKRESAHQFYEALGFEKHGYSFVVSLQ